MKARLTDKQHLLAIFMPVISNARLPNKIPRIAKNRIDIKVMLQFLFFSKKSLNSIQRDPIHCIVVFTHSYLTK